MVHLGMFMMPLHDPNRDYMTVLEEDREAVILADKLGFSECWVGEHYSTIPEGITSPLIFLASVIDAARNITFGTGVFNLPHHHPARLAGDVAMFDHLCGGRFMMGIGPGGLSTDFELFERSDPMTRGKMMIECVDTVLKIWELDAPYDIEGEYWNVRIKDSIRLDHGVGGMLKPLQKPHPPIATSVMGPASFLAKLAGQRGWIPISANFAAEGHLLGHWKTYSAGAAESGYEADPSIWRVARSILVSDDEARACDYVANPESGLHFYFDYLFQNVRRRPGAINNFKTDPSHGDDMVNARYMVDGMVIAGTPDTVLDQLVALRDRLGPFGTLVMCAHDWDDKALWTRSMQLLAEEVMPRLSQHAVAQVAAAQ
jgi:alkanesulfonate monooxygenase SsuD/methylene tetrahydromethanopterin reductase-like flavin-dependent oxidoreductase (luciferase family)